MCICAQSLSPVRPFVTPMDCSLPGFSVHGILQARILEWVVISFSRGSSPTRDRTHVSCISRQVLYHWATWEQQAHHSSDCGAASAWWDIPALSAHRSALLASGSVERMVMDGCFNRMFHPADHPSQINLGTWMYRRSHIIYYQGEQFVKVHFHIQGSI